MAIDFLIDEIPALKRYTGSASLSVAAGKRLQIRYQEGAEIIGVLDEAVPADKQWAVSITISIEETDA